MKLPQVEYRQVESLGRHDTGAVARQAAAVSDAGAADQRIMESMAKTAADFIQRRQDQEYNDAIAQSKIEMSTFKAKHGAKDFYTAEEVSSLTDEQVRKYDIATDDAGNEVKVPRQDIPAYEVYPHLLRQKMQGMTKSISEKVTNPHLKKAYLRNAEVLMADEHMRAAVAAENAQQEYYFKVGVERIEDAARMQDLTTAEFLLENLEADELTKKQLWDRVENLSEIAFFEEAIRSTDQEGILMARQVLDDENYDGTLTEQQRQAVIRDLDQRMQTLDAEMIANRKERHSVTYNDLAVGIMDGQVTRMMVDDAYALWKDDRNNPDGIDPKEHEILVRALNSRQKQATVLHDYKGRFADMLSGKIPADPSNDFDNKTIEWAVETLELTHDNVQRLGQIARGTGIMPEMLKRRINGQMLNGSMEQKTSALVLYNNLQNSDPHLINPLSDATKRKARIASNFMDTGMAPEQAITITEEYMAEVTPERETQIMATYREEDKNNYDTLTDLMDDDERFDKGWFSWGTTPDPYMTADFIRLLEAHLPLVHGNYDMAAQIAYNALRDEWGNTEVGLSKSGSARKRAVRHPPERVLGASTEAIEAGIEQFAETHGINPEHVILHSNHDTPKTQEWTVWTWDDENDELNRLDTQFEGYKWVKKAIADKAKAATELAAEREHLHRAIVNQHEALGDEFWPPKQYTVE